MIRTATVAATAAMLSWPTAAWIREPTQRANRGPPVHRFTLTNVDRTPSTTRVSTDLAPRGCSFASPVSITLEGYPPSAGAPVPHGDAPVRADRHGLAPANVGPMPRHWIWMQVAIMIFVLAGMVIAITRLA